MMADATAVVEEDESCVDPAFVITTLRRVLERGSGDQDRTAAAILLWDLSCSPLVCSLLKNHMAHDVIACVVTSASRQREDRLFEALFGLAANLALHVPLDSLLACLPDAILDSSDTGALTEGFRFWSTACCRGGNFFTRPACLLQLIWVLRNSLVNTLLVRGAELLFSSLWHCDYGVPGAKASIEALREADLCGLFVDVCGRWELFIESEGALGCALRSLELFCTDSRRGGSLLLRQFEDEGVVGVKSATRRLCGALCIVLEGCCASDDDGNARCAAVVLAAIAGNESLCDGRRQISTLRTMRCLVSLLPLPEERFVDDEGRLTESSAAVIWLLQHEAWVMCNGPGLQNEGLSDILKSSAARVAQLQLAIERRKNAAQLHPSSAALALAALARTCTPPISHHKSEGSSAPEDVTTAED